VLTTPRRLRTPAHPVPAVLVALLALVAAAVAAYLRLRVFPDGSLNNDEGVYLRQAQALADGHLRVPFTGDPEAQQPWLFAITDDGYASKYLPVASGLYAVGLLLVGSVTPVLLLLAAAVPVLTYALGRALDLAPGRAVLAAALLALSPGVLVQGGLVLSYLPFLVLLLAGWLAVLRAVENARWAVPAGLLAALAGCVRPLDAVLLLGPPLLWLLWRAPDRVAVLGRVLAGGLPVVALVLLHNQVVTGSPLQMPFNLLEPRDAIGFGDRKLYPEDPVHAFGREESRLGMQAHFWTEPRRWYVGFLVVLPLALWAVRPRGSAGERHRLLLGSAALLLAAYAVFWGPWNASLEWGGTRTIGPFYSLALLPPLVLAAMTVAVRWTPVLVVALLAVSTPVVGQVEEAMDRARDHGRRTADVLAQLDPAVTTVLDVDPPYMGHPVSALGGPDEVLSAEVPASALPPGPVRLLQVPGYTYGEGAMAYALRDLVVSTGPSVRLTVTRPGFAADELVIVSRGGVRTACRQGAAVELVVGPTSVTGCAGEPVPAKQAIVPYRDCAEPDCLSVSTLTPDGSGGWFVGGWRRLPLEVRDGTVALVTDGPVRASVGRGWVQVTQA